MGRGRRVRFVCGSRYEHDFRFGFGFGFGHDGDLALACGCGYGCGAMAVAAAVGLWLWLRLWDSGLGVGVGVRPSLPQFPRRKEKVTLDAMMAEFVARDAQVSGPMTCVAPAERARARVRCHRSPRVVLCVCVWSVWCSLRVLHARASTARTDPRTRETTNESFGMWGRRGA